MILSDRTIRAAWEYRDIGIEPEPDWPTALQPASLDLRLGDVHMAPMPQGSSEELNAWLIGPGDFVLASTLEMIGLPDNLAAQVVGRTTWARKGLLIHVTAGWVDPGFYGQLTLELKNVGTEPILVQEGDRICSLIFLQLTGPVRRLYGSEGLGSKYQGQAGPTLPKND